jgi:hypothetical protein
MKKILLLTVLTTATLVGQPAPAVPAATPTPPPAPSKESIDHLVQLERVTRIHDTVLTQIDKGTADRLRQALRGQPPTPADQAVFADLHTEVVTAVEGVLSTDKLEAVYEKIYSEVYSQQEVDGLIAFYSSPTGQMFAEKQPEISQRTNKLMQQTMLPMIMKIQTATETAQRKIMAAHLPAKPAAPALPMTPPAPATPPDHK